MTSTTEQLWCRRPGCRRLADLDEAERRWCSAVCRAMHFEQTRAKRAALLIGLPVGELFPSLAIASAALDVYAAEWERLTEAATEVGIDPGAVAKPKKTRRAGRGHRARVAGRSIA